jgi:hypothetical protein
VVLPAPGIFGDFGCFGCLGVFGFEGFLEPEFFGLLVLGLLCFGFFLLSSSPGPCSSASVVSTESVESTDSIDSTVLSVATSRTLKLDSKLRTEWETNWLATLRQDELGRLTSC